MIMRNIITFVIKEVTLIYVLYVYAVIEACLLGSTWDIFMLLTLMTGTGRRKTTNWYRRHLGSGRAFLPGVEIKCDKLRHLTNETV